MQWHRPASPLPAAEGPVVVGPYIEVLKDPRGSLSLEDVRSAPYRDRSVPVASDKGRSG